MVHDGKELPCYWWDLLKPYPLHLQLYPPHLKVFTIPFPGTPIPLGAVCGLQPNPCHGYRCTSAFHALWNVNSFMFQPANRCAKVVGLFILLPSFTTKTCLCVPRSSVPGESYRKGWHLFSLERGFTCGSLILQP